MFKKFYLILPWVVMLFIAAQTPVSAQTRVVKGLVVDVSGNPLPVNKLYRDCDYPDSNCREYIDYYLTYSPKGGSIRTTAGMGINS